MSSTNLRQHVIALLQGGHAHITLDQAVADFPVEAMNRRPPHVPYTPWHILEHLRIAQWDILEFVRNPEHESPEWPIGYWPARSAATDPQGWEATLDAFRRDLADMIALVRDPATDLTADLPHAPGYTVLREALLVADHNAYHIGEFAILRQVMQTWGEENDRP